MVRGRSLAHRLVARALVLGMNPAMSVAAKAVLLAQLAVHSPARLEQAIRGIEAGPDRESERGVQAIATLRAAIQIATTEPPALHASYASRLS